MKTYIALLRGINVGGKHIIKMAALRTLLEKSGLKSVRTYIQSGNIIFQHENYSKGELAEVISQLIKKEWGFDVPTLVLNREEIIYAKEKNPFWIQNSEIDITKLAVFFMEDAPENVWKNQIQLPENSQDYFEIKGKYIFVFCPGGFGRSKLTNHFFERELRQICTSRNWRTINKLIELSA